MTIIGNRCIHTFLLVCGGIETDLDERDRGLGKPLLLFNMCKHTILDPCLLGGLDVKEWETTTALAAAAAGSESILTPATALLLLDFVSDSADLVDTNVDLDDNVAYIFLLLLVNVVVVVKLD